MVATEMVGVHGDCADHTRNAESDDAPVIACPTPAPRLPPVHPMPAVGVLAFDERAAPRFEQIFLGREELVARDERPAADPRGGEVDQTLTHQVHAVIAPMSRSLLSRTLRDRTRTPLARTSVARPRRASSPRTASWGAAGAAASAPR